MTTQQSLNDEFSDDVELAAFADEFMRDLRASLQAGPDRNLWAEVGLEPGPARSPRRPISVTPKWSAPSGGIVDRPRWSWSQTVWAIASFLMVGGLLAAMLVLHDGGPQERSRQQAVQPAATPRGDVWWGDAWPMCEVARVHEEPPVEAPAGAPSFLPWIDATAPRSDEGQIIVWMFTGNQPLPVGGRYSDGEMNAKWLWQVSPGADHLTVTAHHRDGTEVNIELSPANANQWSSMIDLPKPGCWSFTVEAVGNRGTISSRFNFVAVDDTASGGNTCPVTYIPANLDTPPMGWGSEQSAWGDDLKVTLPAGSTLFGTRELTNPDGSIWDKFVFWNVDEGWSFRVTGTNADAPGEAVTLGESSWAGGTVAVMLTFPAPGCWTVTAENGDRQVTFTILVTRVYEGEGDGEPTGAPTQDALAPTPTLSPPMEPIDATQTPVNGNSLQPTPAMAPPVESLDPSPTPP